MLLVNAAGTTAGEDVSMNREMWSGDPGTVSSTYTVQPSGENRRCQDTTLRRR